MTTTPGTVVPDAVVAAKQAVCELGAELSQKGWLPATAGNISLRVEGSTDFCITRSGIDKGNMKQNDVLWLSQGGSQYEENGYRPSAETLVHQVLYRGQACGAVAHVHTMYNNLVAGLYFDEGSVRYEGHELLKALDHWDPLAVIQVPIVENYADIPTLAKAVGEAVQPGVPAVLVRNHGIYAWGKTRAEVKRYLEALEFLFEFDIRFQGLTGNHFPPSIQP